MISKFKFAETNWNFRTIDTPCLNWPQLWWELYLADSEVSGCLNECRCILCTYDVVRLNLVLSIVPRVVVYLSWLSLLFTKTERPWEYTGLLEEKSQTEVASVSQALTTSDRSSTSHWRWRKFQWWQKRSLRRAAPIFTGRARPPTSHPPRVRPRAPLPRPPLPRKAPLLPHLQNPLGERTRPLQPRASPQVSQLNFSIDLSIRQNQLFD